LLALAVALATQAGTLVRDGRRAGLRDAHVHTKSSATDVVTEYDRAAERLVVDGLARHRPDDAVVGEEGAARPGTSGLSWFVDPIDGTTNYFYGIPQYAVSIGVADARGMVAGVVVAPELHETFTATRGGGAHLDGEAIAVRDETDLARALVGSGFGYASERRAYQARVMAAVLPRVRDLRRLGAASLDLCYVACGRLDAFFEEGLNRWDMAAGELIAREAGAVASDFRGGPPDPSNLVVCAPALAAPLLALLADAGARPAGRA
jgi:fructose-1,6-bisphosphatase/inositol monophosphatase family enzyme